MRFPGGFQLLVLSVGFCASFGMGAASAQTVLVRSAAPQSSAELIVNADRVATATAGADGIARLSVEPDKQKKAGMDVHIFVDVCGNLHRVLLVETGHDPAPVDTSCQRQSVRELFGVHPNTTLVIDVSSDTPTVLIHQGPAPTEWITGEQGGGFAGEGPPAGIVLSGGVAGARFGNVVDSACGDVSTCSGGRFKGALTGGAALWITRWLGAEATFMKSADVKVSGSGSGPTGATYTFDSVFQTKMLTIAGKVGAPMGAFRIYALAGADRTWATSNTKQTVNATSPAQSSQEAFGFKAAGWGLLFGGGAEAWFSSRLGMYAEAGRAALKGSPTDKSNGTLDDHLTFITIGVRFHIL